MMDKYMKKMHILILVLGVLNAHCAQLDPPNLTNDGLPLKAERTFTINTDQGTCMDIDISPNGKQLAFTLLGNIFTMPTTGGKAAQLTKGLSWDRHPKWSPDGKMLAYLSDGTGTENIWIMDQNGSHQRVISQEGLNAFVNGFRWSDTGNKIEANGHVHDLKGNKRPMAKNDLHTVDSIMKHLELPYSKAVLSPDGQWLAHINLKVWNQRKDGDNHLKLRNLRTGEERCLVCPIDHWRENWEQFTFSKDSRSLWIGYGGKVHKIDIDTGEDTIMPFTADIQVEMGPSLYHTFSMDDKVPEVSYLESGHLSPDGINYVFSALSQLYTMQLPHGKPKVLVEQSTGQFAPRYSPDGSKIAYVTYETDTIGNLWVVSADGGVPKKLTATPGYYQHPEWSPNGKWISVVKAHEPHIWKNALSNVGSLLLISSDGKTMKRVQDSVEIDDSGGFAPSGKELVLLTRQRKSIYKKLQKKHLETGKTTTLALVDRYAKEVSLSPDGRHVLYRIGNSIYLTDITFHRESTPILSHGPNMGQIITINPVQGGHTADWTKDGKGLYYISNSNILEVSLAAITLTLDGQDPSYRKSRNVVPTDTLAHITLPFKEQKGEGVLALTGAKIITMGPRGVIAKGTLVIEGNRITDIGHAGEIPIPEDARIMDVTGRTIVPGLIDMHAHNLLPDLYFPKQWWSLQENLNFGVTTARDPSCTLNNLGYVQLIESGKLIGPRSFGAIAHASDQFRIDTQEDARFLARAEKAHGALFLKVHDEYSRRQRQYMAIAAKEEGLNITGHTASINLHGIYNLSIIMDGYTGREHITGNGRLYNDVAELSKIAKIWHTPTLINSSGKFAEIQHRYRSHLNYPPIKSLDHVPDSTLKKASANTNLMHKESRGMYYARNFANLIKKSARITAGSHGDYPGIQLHWEIWLLQQGGLSPYEALSTATVHAAEGLGLQNDLGSLEKGKIADLLILEKDPLQDIKNTLTIQTTIKNGVVHKPEQGPMKKGREDQR